MKSWKLFPEVWATLTVTNPAEMFPRLDALRILTAQLLVACDQDLADAELETTIPGASIDEKS
jgi:hypothetical protein